MEGIISTFHIDWKIIIAQGVNFLVVLGVLYVFALKPLKQLMKERRDKIVKGLDDAKQSGELLKKASEEYKQNTIKLRQAALEAQKELGKDLGQLRAENIDRIKKDNEEWMKKRVEQLEIDKKALVESAKKEVVSLVIQATEKLVGKDAHMDERVIKELKNLQNG